MSILRRIAQHSRYFFVTCCLQRGTRFFTDLELTALAATLSDVRKRVPAALCAYCLMPDHWHAILLPGEASSISDVMMRVKIASYQRIRKLRADPEPIWQSRFYDHILRTRAEFDNTLEYIHQNPVKAGLVEDPFAWKWSSARWFLEGTGPIGIDEARLPPDPEDWL